MNKIILIGNLTRDPESAETVGGVARCAFTVAVNRRYTNPQGVREADFIPVVAWRQLAENCARYLAKGRKVAVEGSLQTRSYEAQDGAKRYVTEVVADSVEFLTPQAAAAPPPPPPEPPHEPAARQTRMQDMDGFTQIDDDELPF